jgi:exopolysaccharide biosynthesis polyprenyl glycosylphosphotransferase
MIAFFGVFWLRYLSGLFPVNVEIYISDLWLPALVIYAYWLIFYLYNDLYNLSGAPSRTDENFKVFKATSYGVILLFLLTFDMFNPFSIGRLIIIIYWLAQLMITAIFRSIILSIRHNQFVRGIGLTPSLIVGCNPRGYDIYQKIQQHPALGYNIIGFISTDDKKDANESYKGIPILGKLDNIKELIDQYQIKQLVIAFGTDKHDKVLDVMFKVSETKVGMKILPDMYDIFSGLTRTQQILGVPLIDINPNIMSPWEKLVKRCSDIILSVVGLLLFLPFGLIISLVIKLDSKGPVFYTQERLGKGGKPFKMIKFRSMTDKADVKDGKVVVTTEDDHRITKIGQFMRKFRIDEIPQLINVLKGDMSIIGPRPDLKESTDLLEKQLPLYRRRLRVKPGITGWAQITVPYPMTLEEHKQKLSCDIYYIENMSLKLDLKIILNTMATIFSGSGT